MLGEGEPATGVMCTTFLSIAVISLNQIICRGLGAIQFNSISRVYGPIRMAIRRFCEAMAVDARQLTTLIV